MHAAFNLESESEKWSEYYQIGLNISSENKKIIESDLDKFRDIDESLQADKIIDNWFPSIKANVFLSHSHDDEEMVIGFAGWLYDKFELKTFIDSAVWGYSDKLLRLIDDKYCLNPTEKTFDYSKRNRSTSHVHMMLSTALINMIDRCECIIFINTPDSFKPIDYLKNQGKTESPWIFSEIAMMRVIRNKSANEHRPKGSFDSITASAENLREAKELRISYPMNLLHLTDLSVDDLKIWESTERTKKRRAQALDSLYNLKRNK